VANYLSTLASYDSTPAIGKKDAVNVDAVVESWLSGYDADYGKDLVARMCQYICCNGRGLTGVFCE
jgi:hypothetical protein